MLGADAAGVARAADLLSCTYTVIATNVPYLGRGRQDEPLRSFLHLHFPGANGELASAFVQRCTALATETNCCSLVMPDTLGFLAGFSEFRSELLSKGLSIIAYLGSRAFSSISGEVVRPVLAITSVRDMTIMYGVDVANESNIAGKARALQVKGLAQVELDDLRAEPDARWTLRDSSGLKRLGRFASSTEGLSTGDDARYRRNFWEMIDFEGTRRVLGPPRDDNGRWYGGLESILLWKRPPHDLRADDGARLRGASAWGRSGVLVGRIGGITCGDYRGQLFDKSCVALVPVGQDDIAALFSYVASGELERELRYVDRKVAVATKSLEKVPFDIQRWREVAAEAFPDGIPEPWSDDPTQWLFEGRPEESTEPLQVAVGRLVGYQWPEQADLDDLDRCADQDGIVCLPSVTGELPAADRLTALLAQAYGDDWSPGLVRQLLDASGSSKKNLMDWLRDDFFKQHCKVFLNRPFAWHIWDGRRDGFSALVNYHRLDRASLEKLTYTYLGDWIERQRTDVSEDVAGADARLTAARELKAKLEAILEGEPPYDIYIRWRPLHEQPIGWEPDLDDGVRLNIRPFVEAGVLRSKINVHWKKDRGRNPDGSERHNDVPYTRAEKQQAREGR